MAMSQASVPPRRSLVIEITAPLDVLVAVDELSHPRPICTGHRLDCECMFDDRGVQRDLAGGADLTIDQIGSLGDNHRGGDERTVIGSNNELQAAKSGSLRSAAATSTPLSTINTSQDCPNPSASISSTSRAVRPDVDAPIPTNANLRFTGFGSLWCSPSRPASASMSASTVIPRRSASAMSRVAISSTVIDMAFSLCLRRVLNVSQ